MGLSAVLDAVIGLAFIYLLTCILSSSINEFIAQEMGRRGSFLREGLINIVRDRWLYLRIINHPLMAALYRDVPGKPRTPSYIPAANFVGALIEIVCLKGGQLDPALAGAGAAPRTFAEVRLAAIRCREAGYQVGDAILPLLDAAQGNADQARKNLEVWYESGMERVSGWYKAYTRRMLLAVGLAVAVLFNVDTLQIATQLSRSGELRRSLADAATAVVETKRFNGVPLSPNDPAAKLSPKDIEKLAAGLAAYEQQGLPVGFSCLNPEKLTVDPIGLSEMVRRCWARTKAMSVGSWLMRLVGWFITGMAVSLGAPFWFDLLNRLVDLRGAGRKPTPATRAPAS